MNDQDPSTGLRSWSADALVRRRLWLLPLAIVLMIAAFPIARQLELDRSVESLYPDDSPTLLDYRESKASFGGDEFAVVAWTDPELIDEPTQRISATVEQRVDELETRLNELKGIRPASTLSLAGITRRTRALAQEKAEPLAKKMPRFLRQRYVNGIESTALSRMHKLVEGMLIGGDKQTTTIVLRLLPEADATVPRGETIAEIRRIAAEFGEKHNFDVAVVGEPIQIHDMFQYVDEDGSKMFYWSLAALSAVILLLFRSLRWVVLPVLVVLATILWTNALLVLSGTRLSMVSSMMNSLVTIIGVATVMHITVHFREQREARDRFESMRATLRNLLPAIFWTCATTAIGFGALLSSDITPVKSFGLMLATATMIVLLAVSCVVPGGALLGRFDADPRYAPAENLLAGFLTGTAGIVRRHPWIVSLLTAAVFGGALYGFTFLSVETDFSKNFRESSPIVQSLDVVETRLGGAGTWEVSFPAPRDLFDPKAEKRNRDYLARVNKFADTLRKEFVDSGDGDVTKVIAVTDGLNLLPRLLFPTLDEQFKGLKFLHPEFTDGLYDPHVGRMRIVLRGLERRQSADKLKVIERAKSKTDAWAKEELSEWAAEHKQPEFEKSTVKATGLYVLLARLIDNLLEDQLISFAWAAGGIFIMLTIAFRSVTVGLLLLLPNTFPIVLVIGGIGWLGIPVNIATAMIASVSMGLTVDFSIHYLDGYRRARAEGATIDEALKSTLRNVGRALVFSNLALVIGFSVLTVSHFIPLVYFGILVSFAMVGGLIGDLVLLPLILLWTDRK